MDRKDMQIVISQIENKRQKSEMIFDKIIDLPIYQKAKSVMIYFSMPNEVDTKSIIQKSIQLNKDVALPITKNEIHLILIDGATIYKTGAYNIPEPLYGKEIFDVDLAIIPMVMFDEKCNRVGHGKGYFDRFLKDKNCFKLGVAFDEQKVDNLCPNPYDIPMDMVVCQSNIFIR